MFFFLLKLTFQHHLCKIHIAFYLLTWTYFNEINVGRNILINFRLKRIIFISNDKKNWHKPEKDRSNMGKKIIPIKLTSVKMRYQIYILKNLLNFERKTNIGDINVSSSDDEEEGTKYKRKWISNSE